MNRGDFETALARFLEGAANDGNEAVSTTAEGLHRLVGGYPGMDHRKPVCCSVMRAAMRVGDRILHSPPKGNGASLEIYYRLPRSSLSVGELRDALAMYSDDAQLFFGTGRKHSLTFYRVKDRGRGIAHWCRLNSTKVINLLMGLKSRASSPHGMMPDVKPLCLAYLARARLPVPARLARKTGLGVASGRGMTLMHGCFWHQHDREMIAVEDLRDAGSRLSGSVR